MLFAGSSRESVARALSPNYFRAEEGGNFGDLGMGLALKARCQNSLGQRPRTVIGFSMSAEGATQGAEMNRAFSAGGLSLRLPGALPQARMNIAPLALSRYRLSLWLGKKRPLPITA